MIRATLKVRVRPGREAAFEAAWCAVAATVRDAPGNLRQALLADAADPRLFTITSDWESAAGFRAFETSVGQEELTAPLRDLRESATMSVDRLVVHVDGRAPA